MVKKRKKSNLVIFRTLSVIFRANPVIIKTNLVIFRTNALILGKTWDRNLEWNQKLAEKDRNGQTLREMDKN